MLQYNSSSKTICKTSTFYNIDSQKWIIATLDTPQNYFIEVKKNLKNITVSKTDNKTTITLVNQTSDKNNQLFQLKMIQVDKLAEEITNQINKIQKFRYSLVLNITEDISKIEKKKKFFFKNCYFVQSIRIANSITKIPPKTFVNCKRITNIICKPEFLELFPNPVNVKDGQKK